MYLTDRDLIGLLKRCSAALKPNSSGLIIVKENCCRPSVGFIFDASDNSVIRSMNHFNAVFKKAGLKVRATAQAKMPADLVPVRMWALQVDNS